jgi:hypothetical protein
VTGAVVQLASLFSRLDLFKILKILVTSVGISIRAKGTASLRLTEFVTPQDSGGLTEMYAVENIIRGGPKNNRNLNVARELVVIARCAARCRESTQYSSSLQRGVSLG